MTETEVKLSWNGTALEAQAVIERQGYRISAPRALESDQLFDLSSGSLQETDRILRLRTMTSPETGQRFLVTFKGPAERLGYKSREEIEFYVSDGETFALVLDRLGYQPTFRYEKHRIQLRAAGEPGLITIDEVPIGVFLELEGPKEWIDSTAARLGFSAKQFVTLSYAALYREYRKKYPDLSADMTFGSPIP